MTELSSETRPGGVASIGRFFDKVVLSSNGLGAALIFFLMILINADVFGRFLFNSPITGVPLIVTMSLVVIVFLQLADSLRNGRMTRSDAILGKLFVSHPRAAYSLQAVYHFAGIVFTVLLVYFSIPLLEKVWKAKTFAGLEGQFAVPEWPVKFIIIAGAVILGLQFLRLLWRDILILSGRIPMDLSGVESGAVSGKSHYAIWVLCLIFVGSAVWMGLVGGGLDRVEIGILSVLAMLVLVYAGVHVGVALALISFVGVWLIREKFLLAGKMLALSAAESLSQYEFGVIPLFVLMGMLVSVSNIGKDTYEVAHHVFRRVTAGLGMATVAANAVFAAVTGTSLASASVFTKVAVPEMLRLGYQPRFSVGVVAGSSVLGMLIPPSLLLILFGVLSETSIVDLFIAGILPGILLALAYGVLIWFLATRFPKKVFTNPDVPHEVDDSMTTANLLSKSWPIIALIGIVIGGIYGGIFTATEAGGVGALGALLLAIGKRQLSWKKLWHALVETGHVTASVCFLIIAAHLYSRMITVTGIPNLMEDAVISAGLGFTAFLVVYLLLIILLGTILDAASILLITVPLAVPLIAPLGVDMVWFGIMTIIAVEIGLLTPPLGLACFVIHNNLADSRISVNDVFAGAFPFAVVMVMVLIVIALIPAITTILL